MYKALFGQVFHTRGNLNQQSMFLLEGFWWGQLSFILDLLFTVTNIVAM